MNRAKAGWLVWLLAAFSWSACNTLGGPLLQSGKDQEDEADAVEAVQPVRAAAVADSSAAAAVADVVKPRGGGRGRQFGGLGTQSADHAF